MMACRFLNGRMFLKADCLKNVAFTDLEFQYLT